MAMSKEIRTKCEALLFKTMSAIDKTGANTEYYQNLCANMSDAQFEKFIKGRLCVRYHTAPFKNEPKMSDVIDGFKVLNKPLVEKVKLPYLHKNKDGVPVDTQECVVGYMNIKRLKQMLSKKTNTAIDISKRDMKTGRLLGEDKGGLESDKEFEGAMALGLENVTIEYARIKAAAMQAKKEAYNSINVKGEVSYEDINPDKTDSLAKNTFNVYLIGANIHSNLIDNDYYTPHTLAMRKRDIKRELD